MEQTIIELQYLNDTPTKFAQKKTRRPSLIFHFEKKKSCDQQTELFNVHTAHPWRNAEKRTLFKSELA